jgi:HEPN domain-containing protein
VLFGLEQFGVKAGVLTTYAVDSRYPVPHGEISEKEAVEAVKIARNIYEFVLSGLPELGRQAEK